MQVSAKAALGELMWTLQSSSTLQWHMEDLMAQLDDLGQLLDKADQDIEDAVSWHVWVGCCLGFSCRILVLLCVCQTPVGWCAYSQQSVHGMRQCVP